MARDWRKYLDEADSRRRDRLVKIEKIKKQKRSVRGRTVDDWLVDRALKEGEESESEFSERLLGLSAAGQRRGRVIEVHKRNIFVAEEDRDGKPQTDLLWLCSIAKRHFQRAHKERNFVVVGDQILFEPDAEVTLDSEGQPKDTDLPRGVIQHAFIRHSRIARRDPLNPEWEHVMLANIDLLVVVASVFHPEVRWGLIDRFLVQAELEGLPAAIVLNKVDLLNNPKLATEEFLKRYNKRVSIYKQIGYDVFEICALHPRKSTSEVKRLREMLKGKLIGLAGHSGVGKSSLLNLMKPEFEQIVDDNPEIFYKGRHTTTYNSLLQLGIGAYAIDTPGVRAFSVDGFDSITLSQCFPEFRGIRCHYRECTHDHEPKCGIKDAVEDGRISQERYRSFIGLLKGISFREGEGDASEAEVIADIAARSQVRDEKLREMEKIDGIEWVGKADEEEPGK
ncbi:MAG: ribosome small subunit-dependent GTPase A [Silvanigrellaceae bacterium]